MGIRWSEEDNEYLTENWGRFSLFTLSQNLKRTPEAVRQRAGKLGLGPMLDNGEYITFHQLIQAVTGSCQSYSHYLVTWVKNRGFPIHKKRVRNHSFRVVFIDEFWEWAEKNRNYIDFSKMEPFALGEEPEWVKEQRVKNFKKLHQQNRRLWTPADDDKLKFLLKQNKYGYKEIASLLYRSEGAVQRRCFFLGIKDRPIRADNHGEKAAWTSEKFKILEDGIKNGDDYFALSLKIGKSEKAIRGKVSYTYFTEDIDKVRAMIGNGKWGDNVPSPKVYQAYVAKNYKSRCKKELSALVNILSVRAAQLN